MAARSRRSGKNVAERKCQNVNTTNSHKIAPKRFRTRNEAFFSELTGDPNPDSILHRNFRLPRVSSPPAPAPEFSPRLVRIQEQRDSLVLCASEL